MSEAVETVVALATPAPIISTAIPSIYRVFGTLPTKALLPVEANAVTGITWGAAGITALFIVVYGFCIIRSRSKLINDGQLWNAISTIFGLVCIFLGFVSVGDSVQQYPDEVTLMGQISGSICFMGISLFSLCPLILTPFMKRDRENYGLGDKIRTPSKVVFAVAVVSFVISVALEIAVICLRKTTPRALLIVIFAYRLFVIAIMLCLGSYVLISAFSVQKNKKRDQVIVKNMKRLLFNKLITLTLGVSAVTSWTVCNAFESPHVLWMRGGETISLFVLICVQLSSSISVLHALDDVGDVDDLTASLLTEGSKQDSEVVANDPQGMMRRNPSSSTVNL